MVRNELQVAMVVGVRADQLYRSLRELGWQSDTGECIV